MEISNPYDNELTLQLTELNCSDYLEITKQPNKQSGIG